MKYKPKNMENISDTLKPLYLGESNGHHIFLNSELRILSSKVKVHRYAVTTEFCISDGTIFSTIDGGDQNKCHYVSTQYTDKFAKGCFWYSKIDWQYKLESIPTTITPAKKGPENHSRICLAHRDLDEIARDLNPDIEGIESPDLDPEFFIGTKESIRKSIDYTSTSPETEEYQTPASEYELEKIASEIRKRLVKRDSVFEVLTPAVLRQLIAMRNVADRVGVPHKITSCNKEQIEQAMKATNSSFVYLPKNNPSNT